tara:strand:- start:4086 stop:4229 length:144 start_codon:yes stop_codon:yes gene_type:complete
MSVRVIPLEGAVCPSMDTMEEAVTPETEPIEAHAVPVTLTMDDISSG